MDKEIKKDTKFKKGNKQGKKFSSDYQPSEEAKSRGHINASIGKNIIATLRTEIQQNTTILKDLPKALQEEVNEGKLDNAIKLLNIIKEPEKQEVKLDGGLEIQKVFIEEATKKDADDHIDKFIDGN